MPANPRHTAIGIPKIIRKIRVITIIAVIGSIVLRVIREW